MSSSRLILGPGGASDVELIAITTLLARLTSKGLAGLDRGDGAPVRTLHSLRMLRMRIAGRDEWEEASRQSA